MNSQRLTEEDLEAALREQRRSGGRLGEVLVRLGHLSEQDLVATLGAQLGLGTIDLESFHASSTLLRRLSAEDAHRLQVLPVEEADGAVVIAVADAPRGPRLEEIKQQLRTTRVVPRLCSSQSLKRALIRHYGPRAQPRPAPSPELRALIDLLVERQLISWAEYVERLHTHTHEEA